MEQDQRSKRSKLAQRQEVPDYVKRGLQMLIGIMATDLLLNVLRLLLIEDDIAISAIAGVHIAAGLISLSIIIILVIDTVPWRSGRQWQAIRLVLPGLSSSLAQAASATSVLIMGQ
ncbi:uncharacterized protein MONBRDRAFT_11549, partial [Monosiga brevicollis MX1]